MNRRKEICRNFQRGSCQYGDRCKFLHVTQQQSKPNPFGFGTQGTLHFPNTSSQQKHNPFGFGMKNDTQSQSNLKDSSNFGARDQIPTKPFQNKWTRSSAGSTGVTSSQQPEAQSHSSDHQCTDPELCKKVILDDFKSEAPIWKLTCYGHRKYGPCDIVGDISYEELREAAYQDVRSGMNVQSIVERERNLCVSKLNEFDNLLKNPYVSQNPRFPQTSPPPPVSIINAPSSKFQSNGTPSFSSFSQLNSAANLGPASTNPPGIQNRPSFSSFSQLNSAANLGSNSTNPPGIQNSTVFGQSNPMQGARQNSAGFGAFGQQPKPFGNSLVSSFSTFNAGVKSSGSPLNSYPQQFGGTNNQQLNYFTGSNAPSVTVQQPPAMNEQDVSADDSTWLKEEWEIGEIPENPPPDKFC